jgi:energy-coupling factor transport system ATP-binding protein
MSSEARVIETQDLGFRAGDTDAVLLDGISLRIGEGERVGIVGPSGAGKTTLALHLAGLHRAALFGRTSGVLRLRGRDCAREGCEGFAGVVLQNPEIQLFGETVREEIELSVLNRAILVDPGAEIERFLDLFGLQEFRDRRVAELSLGWKQRLSVASMLALDPAVILLDEPTNYLDDAAATELFRTLRSHSRRTGLVVLVVEHDLARLQKWATRIVAMEAGRVVFDGTPAAHAEWAATGVPFPVAGSLDGNAGPAAASSVAPLLVVNRVSFRYGDGPWVFKDVSFPIGPGEIVAVTGPNGSGKTTLLRMIKGLHGPSKGCIFWTKDQSRMDAVGLVFQNPDAQLFAHTTLEEGAFLPLNQGFGRSEAEARTRRALEQVGLLAHVERVPFSLSYGEKRRLTVASVVSGRTPLLCLDEPTVGLDAGNLGRLAGVLREIAAAGTAVVLATHDAGFVRQVATRVVELRNGLAPVAEKAKAGCG